MYLAVSLDGTSSSPVLHDLGDLRSLRVVVHGERGDLAAGLAGVGYLAQSGDAFLDIAALVALAGDYAHDAEWRNDFDAMVDYARTKGWVAADGRALQAHCERIPPASPSRP